MKLGNILLGVTAVAAAGAIAYTYFKPQPSLAPQADGSGNPLIDDYHNVDGTIQAEAPAGYVYAYRNCMRQWRLGPFGSIPLTFRGAIPEAFYSGPLSCGEQIRMQECMSLKDQMYVPSC